MPWEAKKAETKKEVYSTVGAVACYKVKREVDPDVGEQENWTFTKMWVKGYPVQTGSMFYNESKGLLLVGFDDGSIKKLQIEGL